MPREQKGVILCLYELRAFHPLLLHKYCMRYDANLASIHNSGEYQFIQEVVRGVTGRFPRAWIGGNDAVKVENSFLLKHEVLIIEWFLSSVLSHKT